MRYSRPERWFLLNSKQENEKDQPQSSKSDAQDQNDDVNAESNSDDTSTSNDQEEEITINLENGFENVPAEEQSDDMEKSQSDIVDEIDHFINEEPLNAVVVDDDDAEMADEFFELVPPDETIGSDVIEKLQNDLRKKAQESKDNFDRLVRFQAEFENFKKRHYREKQDFKKYCIESIMLELLPNLDNLERALESTKKSADLDSVIEGIEMIHRGLSNCLQKFGLKPIDTGSAVFNPVEHEAMMIVDSTEHKNNMIIEEFQKGYYLHDRVIRPSLVSVAKHVAAVKDENEEPDNQIDEAIKEITNKFKLSKDFREDIDSESEPSSDVDNHDDSDNNNS